MSSRRRCEHQWPQFPRLLGTPSAAGLPSSARYAATASVRGLLVAEIQVLVPYRIHPSIHPSVSSLVWSGVALCILLLLLTCARATQSTSYCTDRGANNIIYIYIMRPQEMIERLTAAFLTADSGGKGHLTRHELKVAHVLLFGAPPSLLELDALVPKAAGSPAHIMCHFIVPPQTRSAASRA